MDWMSHMPDELRDRLTAMGEAAYRGGQLFQWFSKAAAFDEMANLPVKLRERLAAEGPAQPAMIEERFSSSDGSTEKVLFRLADGHKVEGVLMRYRHGNTFCVSSQVGCRMGCRFCASTIGGRERDLTAGEMHSMTALICALAEKEGAAENGRRGVTNVVMMGNGEPLDNYEASVRYIRLISSEQGLGISPRNVSLSTCGLADGIRRFTEEGLPVTLSLSLHATTDQTRREIMPVANSYTIRETLNACRAYIEKSRRRLIIEYTLIAGVNDSPDDTKRLSILLRGMRAHVNLIELNAVAESPLKPSVRAAAFEAELNHLNVSVTRRRSLGSDVKGACGQLRAGRDGNDDGPPAANLYAPLRYAASEDREKV